MKNTTDTSPRLYVPGDLEPGAHISLPDGQIHYLRSVLRMNTGDKLRLFNAQSGEFSAILHSIEKRQAMAALQVRLREPHRRANPVHLLFAPIKKQRLDILIEKSVELGVTDLHPVITHRTENRHLKEDRLRAQIIEAAEQCERLDIPVLHEPAALERKIASWPNDFKILWAQERGDCPPLRAFSVQDWAFLIGPEGGFDESEIQKLGKHPALQAVSLGDSILRAETAALMCLSHAALKSMEKI